MGKTIQQTVKFDVPPERLFDIYMDSRKHSAAIDDGRGRKAVLSRKVGGKFMAHNRHITGRNLALVPKRMIVQSWRMSNWKRTDPDSVLILTFDRIPGGSKLTMVHANVPDDKRALLDRGWRDHYWRPWRAYLSQK